MKILSLDTATEACSAALLVDGQVNEIFEVCPRRHNERILDMCDQLLQQANLSLSQLDCIGVGQGPGSFTGVRLATSVAQGLSYGANLPLVPISTLQAVAHGALSRCQKPIDVVICAMDARMGQVYFEVFDCRGDDLKSIVPAQVVSPDMIAPLPPICFESNVLACGHGFAEYQEALIARLECSIASIDKDALPHAQDIAHLAARAFAQGQAQAPAAVQPLYLRNHVVHQSSS